MHIFSTNILRTHYAAHVNIYSHIASGTFERGIHARTIREASTFSTIRTLYNFCPRERLTVFRDDDDITFSFPIQ